MSAEIVTRDKLKVYSKHKFGMNLECFGVQTNTQTFTVQLKLNDMYNSFAGAVTATLTTSVSHTW